MLGQVLLAEWLSVYHSIINLYRAIQECKPELGKNPQVLVFLKEDGTLTPYELPKWNRRKPTDSIKENREKLAREIIKQKKGYAPSSTLIKEIYSGGLRVREVDEKVIKELEEKLTENKTPVLDRSLNRRRSLEGAKYPKRTLLFSPTNSLNSSTMSNKSSDYGSPLSQLSDSGYDEFEDSFTLIFDEKLTLNNSNSDERDENHDVPLDSSNLFSITRKGLSKFSNQNLMELLALPITLTIGEAIDDGGYFFDALAQALNSSQQTTVHSEKTLRMVCYQYYLKNKQQVDKWNEKDDGSIDKGEDYYLVQYTNEELKQYFNGKTPIWGRPYIEGRILCAELNLSHIHYIELLNNPENNELIAGYFTVSQSGKKAIETKDFSYKTEAPILVVSQQDLHFVPLLPQPSPTLSQSPHQFFAHSQKVDVNDNDESRLARGIQNSLDLTQEAGKGKEKEEEKNDSFSPR